MTALASALKRKLRKEGLRFNKAYIPDDVFRLIKRRQAEKEQEIKKQFSMESTVYLLIRESETRK